MYFRTLSAIYSQLGNAYFYLGDYVRAMQYHKHDLTLARTMGDRLGEAKASGNLGNTLKVIGMYVDNAGWLRLFRTFFVNKGKIRLKTFFAVNRIATYVNNDWITLSLRVLHLLSK